MADNGRTPETVRLEIEAERKQLAEAVDTLHAKLRAKVPVIAAGGLVAGFVLSGGIGATMRLLHRRGR